MSRLWYGKKGRRKHQPVNHKYALVISSVVCSFLLLHSCNVETETVSGSLNFECVNRMLNQIFITSGCIT